jgi:hypothetical protein
MPLIKPPPKKPREGAAAGVAGAGAVWRPGLVGDDGEAGDVGAEYEREPRLPEVDPPLDPPPPRARAQASASTRSMALRSTTVITRNRRFMASSVTLSSSGFYPSDSREGRNELDGPGATPLLSIQHRKSTAHLPLM